MGITSLMGRLQSKLCKTFFFWFIINRVVVVVVMGTYFQRIQLQPIPAITDLRPIYFPQDRITTTRNAMMQEASLGEHIFRASDNQMTRRRIQHIVMDRVMELDSIPDITKYRQYSSLGGMVRAEMEFRNENVRTRRGAHRVTAYRPDY